MRIPSLLATLTLTAGFALASSSCIIVTDNVETADMDCDACEELGDSECCAEEECAEE